MLLLQCSSVQVVIHNIVHIGFEMLGFFGSDSHLHVAIVTGLELLA